MKPTIAVDLAKSVFEVAVSQHPGKVAERHRLSRVRVLPFFAQREASTVLVEACGSAHFWAGELQKLGHEVVLLPPHASRRTCEGCRCAKNRRNFVRDKRWRSDTFPGNRDTATSKTLLAKSTAIVVDCMVDSS